MSKSKCLLFINNMGYYAAHGLRGSILEDLLNKTNQEYYDDDLAVIQKVPTPIKPVELDHSKGVITLAYFDAKSTVDYIGNVQGYPVCFDAKETKGNNLPLSNIHEHQIDFMGKFASQGGISFILVYFTDHNRFMAMEIKQLEKIWTESKSGGRKSIPIDWFDEDLEIHSHSRYLVHYLEVIEKIINK